MTASQPEVSCTLMMPGKSGFADQICRNAAWAMHMVQVNSHIGQSVAIYGAGPSLADAPWETARNERWACNSALPYLMDRGAPITHGITVDQGSVMLGPAEWFRTFDVDYLLSSSVHPEVVQHLAANHRRFSFFHNFLGIDTPPDWITPDPEIGFEMFLYRRLYPTSVMVGQGLNTGARAVCLALVMGFSEIHVHGLDCATASHPAMPPRNHPGYVDWINRCVLYADGRTVGEMYGDTVMAEAEFDGRLWHTRPDMIRSALDLLNLQRMYPGRIHYHGDTLVTAIAPYWEDPEFSARMPVLNDDGTMTNFGLPTAFTDAAAGESDGTMVNVGLPEAVCLT